MILPNNGKVVIIDDENEEVASLFIALKKEKMPFLYFEDRGGDDLPENGPIDDIRLVFLDLDLGLGDNNPISKIRVVQSRLERIIKPNTPYVLIIWSSHEDRLAQTLLDEFNNGFKAYKPIAHCSLDKLKTLKETDVVKTIRAKLLDSLKKFEAFNAFLFWESIVNTSVGKVTSDLVSIFEKDENWDKNLKNAFYKIALAELGSELVKNLTDLERIKLAIKVINSSLIDCVENFIENQFNDLSISDVKEGGTGLKKDAIIRLNTNIHIIKTTDLNHFSPGNLYISDQIENQKDNLKAFFIQTCLDAILELKPKIIQLDITPACDYSQSKQFTRIISGLMWNDNSNDIKLRENNFIYKECPIIDIDSPVHLIFDFRSLKSFSKREFEAMFIKKPNARLRNNLLIDIQAQLSNHINRPGIFQLK